MNKNLVKAAILTMSFVQMGTNGISPILAQIAAALNVSDSTAQFLMTFPSFFMMVFTLLCAIMSEKLPKKLLAVIGLACVSAAGVLAFLFHGSITILFVWAAIMGIGIGLVAPVAPSLISELFEGNERQTLMGQQNSAASVGSMLMTFFGGLLAAAGWQFGYLVYLIGIPGLILTLIAIPDQTSSTPAAKSVDKEKSPVISGKLPPIYWEMFIACVFMILFNCGPTNLSMLVVEKGIGSSSLAGTLATVFLLGGVLAGLIFGLLASKVGSFTIPIGALSMVAGYLLMGFSSNIALMVIGCLLAGSSVSLFMPSCMMVASHQKGRETLASAMILASSNLGVFMAPLLTKLTVLVTGSSATAPRFIVAAVLAVLVGIITSIKRS